MCIRDRSYIVEINGKQINNGASNIFSNFEYGQNNVIRVRAVGGEGTFSSFGSSATKTYLGAPTDVRYDGEVITWRGSTQAKSYELYINDNLIADGLTGGRYEYTADNTQFTICLLYTSYRGMGTGRRYEPTAFPRDLLCPRRCIAGRDRNVA